MTPVAAYVRMSTTGQKYSIENQLAAIEAYCDRNDMDLVRTYSDAGRSGVSIDHRPGLQALVAAAEAGDLPFTNVIVFDISRWGRFPDADEGAYYEHVLRLAGAPVLYCAESFDNDETPIALIVKSFKRAMASEYSRELSRRTRMAKRRLAASGARVAGAPGYGYRRAVRTADGRVHPRELATAPAAGLHTLMLGPEGEVAAVRRIYDLRIEQQMTVPRILRTMLDEGRPAPAGGWTYCVVNHILSNEKYAGTLVYGRRHYGGPGDSRRLPEVDWLRVKDAHPAIIDRERFHAAQAAPVYRGFRDRDAMVAALKAVYARHGVLTPKIIQAAPDLPAYTTILRQFGSMRGARDAAGVAHQGRSAR